MIRQLASNLNRYRMRSRMVLAYILISLCTTIALSITIYQILANDAMNRIGENSLLSLKQTAYAADTVYSQMKTVMSQMLGDPSLQHFIYAREDDKVVTYRASLALQRLKGVYPFIQSIELYNSNSGSYYSTLTLNPLERATFAKNTAELYRKLGKVNLSIYPHEIRTEDTAYTKVGSYQALSFLFHPMLEMENKSIVILNMDLNYIRDSILSYSTSASGSQTFMLNGNNLVLAHNRPDMFMKDFSGENYLRFFSNGRTEGYSIRTLNGKRCLVSFTMSRASNWYFISIIPYESIVGGLSRTRDIVLVSSAATFLVALVVSIWIMRNIYNPFQRLLDRMGGVPAKSTDLDILTQTISRGLLYQRSHEAYSQEVFAYELLTGIRRSVIDDDTRAMLANRFCGASALALLFRVDGYGAYKRGKSAEQRSMMHFGVSKAIQEVVSHTCACSCITIGEDEIAALLSFDETPDLNRCLMEITELTHSIFGVGLSCAAGCPVNSLSGARQSYDTASRLMRYRVYFSRGALLDEVGVQPFINNDAAYPAEIESGLQNVIESNAQKALDGLLSSLKEALMGAYCGNVRFYAMKLVYSLLRSVDASALKSDPLDSIETISESDTIDDMVQDIRSIVLEIATSLQESHMRRISKKYVSTISDIKRIVEETYNNPNLSIDTVAESASLSPQYIRKLFKQLNGASFSHFLMEFRLGKAKELLHRTDLPAMQIGEKVGLYNVTYFFTAFRKAYGISPVAYREQVQNKIAH